MHSLRSSRYEFTAQRQSIKLFPDTDHPRQQSVSFIHALAVVHQASAYAALEALVKVQLGAPMAAVGADKPWAGAAQGWFGIINGNTLSGCFPATCARVVPVPYLQRTINAFNIGVAVGLALVLPCNRGAAAGSEEAKSLQFADIETLQGFKHGGLAIRDIFNV